MTSPPPDRREREFVLIVGGGIVVAALLARALLWNWASDYGNGVIEPLLRYAFGNPLHPLRASSLRALPPAAMIYAPLAPFYESVSWQRLAKLPAFAFEPLAAYVVFRLVRAVEPAGWRAWLAVAATLLAPTMLLNGALIGWDDVVWASVALLCVLCVVAGRSRSAAASFAAAVGLGLPALALAPFLVVAAFARRIRWPAFYLIPFVLAWAIAPAVFTGHSVLDVLSDATRLLPVGRDPGTGGGAPSPLWFLSRENPDVGRPFALGAYLLACIGLVRVAALSRRPFSAEIACFTAYVFAMLGAFLVPAATARVTLPADLLVIALAGMNPAYLPLALAQQLVSWLACMPKAMGPPEAGALAASLSIVLVPWAIARWIAALHPDASRRWSWAVASGPLLRAGAAMIVAFVAWMFALRLLGGTGFDVRTLWPLRRDDLGGLGTFLVATVLVLPALRALEDRLRARWGESAPGG